uniref:L1 transposable element RRM domain-containing protein n=2 Tax=Micrurus TaxID=8634 RepID=A0A2D4GPE2_MICCO
MDQKIIDKNKETEEALTHLEMDRASYYLRFQNVEEDKEENLALVMAEIVAELLQREKNETINELDDVYRVFTSYARRHRLPREVHIRFARRQVKDIIYKISRDEVIKYKGREIIMLKQVPRRVREQQKDYRFLTNYLNKKNISFRWITLVGIWVTWKEKRMKIDTLSEAQHFYEQIGGPEDESSSRDELETSSQEESPKN